MKVPLILEECRTAGVVVSMSNGVVTFSGTKDARDKLSTTLKLHKPDLIKYLAEIAPSALAHEFMEVDGMTREEAEKVAAVSIPSLR